MDGTSAFQLCSNCSKIRFDQVFSGKADQDDGPWRLVFLNELAETCSFCSFLLSYISTGDHAHCAGQQIRVELDFDPPDPGNPHLRILSLSVSSKEALFPIFSPRSILCVTSEWQKSVSRWIDDQPQLIPPLLSYATIIKWMYRTMPYLESQNEPTEQVRSSVPLTVIDCATRNLVLLPVKEPYVTLSYVWGTVNSGQITLESGKGGSRSLPLELPPTIEDCITVCLGLNFRYLWVDRYCIYGSHDMRAQQIKEMDKVYSESALTVIACAGEDPTYGLPGVSRPRTSCSSLGVKDLGYLWTIPSTIDIKTSIWATRGWTFQEALLSKCQLYFTNKQLFLGHYDAIESELGNWVPNELWHTYQSTYSLGPLDTYSCIGMYSDRCLSYPEDILNAFLGILSRLREDRGVLHLWGLPFRGSDHINIIQMVYPFELVFEVSLCWEAHKPKRREGFPTWSWTSNDGQVYWARSFPLGVQYEPSDPETAPKFEVELMSGKLCSLSEFQLCYDDLNDYSKSLLFKDRPSQFIHIEAFVSPVVSIKTDGDWTKVGVNSTTGELVIVLRNPLSAPISPESALIIHLIYGVPVYRNHALLVKNMGSHWERVGVIDDTRHRLEGTDKVRKKLRLG